MSMTVVVFGSSDSIEDDSQKATFRAACEQLGREIVSRKCSLITISDKEEHADRHVVLGAAGAAREGTIARLFLRADNPRAFREMELQGVLGHLKLDRHASTLNPNDARMRALTESDVVVIVGGGDSSEFLAAAAKGLHKTVIPVGCFPGAGKTILQDYVRTNEGWGAGRDEVAALSGGWVDTTAATIMSFAEQLYRKKSSSFLRKNWFLIAVLVLYFSPIPLAWVTGVVGAAKIQATIGFAVAGLVGAAAGMGVRVLGMKNPDINGLKADLSRSILATFGVAVLYIVGGISIVTDSDKLGELTDPGRFFVLCLFIGFVGGLKPQQVIDKITEKVNTSLE